MRISDWSSDVCSSDLPEAQRVMRAAHRQHGGSCRKPLVEDVDLRVRVAPELERDQREQDGLAGAGRPDHQHVPDLTDMGRQRSEEHTSELQSLMRISYAVFCYKKQRIKHNIKN